jgi:hypothetical protein
MEHYKYLIVGGGMAADSAVRAVYASSTASGSIDRKLRRN